VGAENKQIVGVTIGPNIPSEEGPLLGELSLYKELRIAPPLSVQVNLEYPFLIFNTLESLHFMFFIIFLL
jgi:hypothetical protein